DIFRRRKMESRINKLTNHYIVCGATHTGLSVVEELKKTNKSFALVVLSDEEYEKFSAEGLAVVKGDATNDDVLIKANIKAAAGIFCALRNDKENAFIALTARGLNSSLKIISAQNEEGVNIKNKLLRSGADIVVNPHFIGGLRMASEMIRPTIVNFLDYMLKGKKDRNVRFDEISLNADSSIIGSKLDFVQKMDDALVVAIKNKNNDYEINPSEDRILEKDDIIVALGSVEQIESFKSKIN
ncbi:MAG: NAD-binding protein, partial [Elusimicrobiota bacterium]|nr:NAD-binding protein [Elusimicrobiota bacterium]